MRVIHTSRTGFSHNELKSKWVLLPVNNRKHTLTNANVLKILTKHRKTMIDQKYS